MLFKHLLGLLISYPSKKTAKETGRYAQGHWLQRGYLKGHKVDNFGNMKPKECVVSTGLGWFRRGTTPFFCLTNFLEAQSE